MHVACCITVYRQLYLLSPSPSLPLSPLSRPIPTHNERYTFFVYLFIVCLPFVSAWTVDCRCCHLPYTPKIASSMCLVFEQFNVDAYDIPHACVFVCCVFSVIIIIIIGSDNECVIYVYSAKSILSHIILSGQSHSAAHQWPHTHVYIFDFILATLV